MFYFHFSVAYVLIVAFLQVGIVKSTMFLRQKPKPKKAGPESGIKQLWHEHYRVIFDVQLRKIRRNMANKSFQRRLGWPSSNTESKNKPNAKKFLRRKRHGQHFFGDDGEKSCAARKSVLPLPRLYVWTTRINWPHDRMKLTEISHYTYVRVRGVSLFLTLGCAAEATVNKRIFPFSHFLRARCSELCKHVRMVLLLYVVMRILLDIIRPDTALLPPAYDAPPTHTYEYDLAG